MAALSTLRRPAKAIQRLRVCVQLLRTYIQLLQLRASRLSPRTLRLLSLVVSLVSLLSSTLLLRRWYLKRLDDRDQGRLLLRRNSGIWGKDGSRTIYVPYKKSTAKVVIHPTKETTFDAHRRLFLNPPRSTKLGDIQTPSQVPPATIKPGLNLAFLHQFLSLVAIMVPRWNSKETGLLISHSAFLMLRTYLSLVVARLDGELVRDLISANRRGFLIGLIKWCGIGSTASYTNAMIKYLQSKISIAFRTRLTRYIHDLYLDSNLSYYKLSNLDGGIGQGADQFITQDLTLFCDSAAALYSSLGKPTVDLFVFNYQLFRSLGPVALVGLLSNYFLTASLLRKLSPPFGRLKAIEAKREGDFRAMHSRLIANSEEVAFYGGAQMEKSFLDKGYRELRRWMETIYGLKIRYNMLEDFVLKYSWSAFGYIITSLPIFLPAWGGLGGMLELAQQSKAAGHSGRERGRMQEFITNKRLMLSLADAGGRMMYSIKDLAELAGYTSRVYTLVSTLHRVHANHYPMPRVGYVEPFSLFDVQGTMHKGFEGVRLENVPIVAPALLPRGGEELIDSLTVHVYPNQHLLITGPNGVGKSAVARVLAGLWPVYRGLVSEPRAKGPDGILFLPQRPYLSSGTLRDQITYPDTEPQMRSSGRTDADLQAVLDLAGIGYLTAREPGGWDARQEWTDVLSGGERQKVAVARCLWHRPRIAVWDEATSAVSQDAEGLLYERAKAVGITIVTISTRLSLRRFHDFALTLGLGDDGAGWSLERIGTEREILGRERELGELMALLEKVDGLRLRRDEIEGELGRVWVGGEVLEPPAEMSQLASVA